MADAGQSGGQALFLDLSVIFNSSPHFYVCSNSSLQCNIETEHKGPDIVCKEFVPKCGVLLYMQSKMPVSLCMPLCTWMNHIGLMGAHRKFRLIHEWLTFSWWWESQVCGNHLLSEKCLVAGEMNEHASYTLWKWTNTSESKWKVSSYGKYILYDQHVFLHFVSNIAVADVALSSVWMFTKCLLLNCCTISPSVLSEKMSHTQITFSTEKKIKTFTLNLAWSSALKHFVQKVLLFVEHFIWCFSSWRLFLCISSFEFLKKYIVI